MQLAVLLQTFDRRDLLAGDDRDRRDARTHRLTVDVNRAGPTQAGTAAELGSREVQMIPEHPEEWCVGRRIGLEMVAIHGERGHDANLFDGAHGNLEQAFGGS